MRDKFLTPDDVKSMVKVFITSDLREIINNNIKDMVANNKNGITICTLSRFDVIIINDIMKEMCVTGWRVSRHNNNDNTVSIVLENPYYKTNKMEDDS